MSTSIRVRLARQAIPLEPRRPAGRRAARPFFAAMCAAGLAACGDMTAPETPALDVSDAAPYASQSTATPGTMRDAVLAWNDVISQFFHPPIFVPGQPPPADARGYAMASVAMHDALNAIDRRYASYAYHATVSEPVSGEAAVAAAVHGVLAALGSAFPTPGPVEFVEARFADALAVIPDGPQRAAGIALGQAVAAAVLAIRSDDGSAGPLFTPYSTSGNPGEFRPLVPDPSATALDGLAAIQHWGNQRPFVMNTAEEFRADAPYGAASLAEAVQTPQYLADYAETNALGGVVSQRTADQTEIGLFWIESSALGWNRVARAILERRPQTAWRTARILALVHLAIADAYIANFDSKYYWDFWRPVTAIRLGNMDPATPGDPTWNAASVAAGLGGTPPIPEWPSAHAMAGAAAAEAIAAGIPGTTAFTMNSTEGSGMARSYPSLDAAVSENNDSRIYIGYHWRAATTEGERLGRLVGRYIVEHSLQPTAGN
jgi:membrane-associated phospholipid phosphatase